jgi:hypothetical protein
MCALWDVVEIPPISDTVGRPEVAAIGVPGNYVRRNEPTSSPVRRYAPDDEYVRRMS